MNGSAAATDCAMRMKQPGMDWRGLEIFSFFREEL